MPERTHYERALRKVKRMDVARGWARASVRDADPVAALIARMHEHLSRARNPEREAQHLATEMIGYVHALVVEFLRPTDYSYSDLTERNPHYGKLMATVAGTDQHAMNSSGQMYYQMASHELAGKRVYEVTAGLADRLMHTELRGLTTDDLRLPERSIFIMVPRSAGLRVFNEDTGWHALEGVYVTADTEDDGTRCWRFMACGESKPIQVEGLEFDNDAIVYWRVPLPEGLGLDQAIENAHSNMVRDTVAHESPFRGMWQEWTKIFAFVMNTVIYTTWPDCERENVYANREAKRLWDAVNRHPKGSSKRGRAQRKLSAIDPMRRTVLGRSITIDRSAPQSGEATGSGRPLTVRTRVHGHWRRQAHGKGMSERKLIWIEPHWRGPLDGEETNGRHRLK